MGFRDYFQDSLSFEASHREQIKDFLIAKLAFLGLDPQTITSIAEAPDGIRDDKDWAFRFKQGEIWCTVEVKLRSEKYSAFAERELLIETESSLESNTPGWIFKSQATYLAYLWLRRGIIHGKIMSMKLLREWWKENEWKYGVSEREHLAPNPPSNPTYHTRNYSVSWHELPKNLFLS